MTTPYQLAKWREEFETNTKPHKLVRYSGGAYQLDYMEDTWTGYLRAKQENEQAIKDARKLALEEAIAICKAFLSGGSNGIQAARVCAYNIQELLK